MEGGKPKTVQEHFALMDKLAHLHGVSRLDVAIMNMEVYAA